MSKFIINEDGTVNRFSFPEKFVGRPLLSDLNFTLQELLAITKLGLMMAASDGKLEDGEMRSLSAELLQISSGISVENLRRDCVNFPHEDAVFIVKNMSDKQKQYVTAFLITIMNADRNIHDGERLYLHVLTNNCDLPEMSVNEARKIMINL